MSKIYIVATPIGNLEDITLRAIRVFNEVDFIACEDTRHTSILLNHLKIKKPLISYHQHSKISKVDKLIDLLNEGKNIAVVTDAGTPGIADPGNKLVEQVAGELGDEIEIISIPGASAAVSALSVSGFKADEFLFLGFLPTKKGRQTMLKTLSTEQRTTVLYESPYRIKKLLREINEFLGNREIVVCRELTKKFEEIYRGSVKDIVNQVKEKGEFVVVISNK